MKRRASTHITRESAGVAILDFLSLRFTYHQRDHWEDLIRSGRVLVNGGTCVPGTILESGNSLEYLQPEREEPPVSVSYSILFEDRALLVINKPGNLPCHPGGRYFRNTLWGLLKTERTDEPLFFVNRIDRETSGIVLLAKTASAAKDCQRQFQSGTVRKTYLVGVEGDFSSGPVCAEGLLFRDETSLIRKKHRFSPMDSGREIPDESRRCLTRFRLLERCGELSLVYAFPVTGRFHQIRATLFSLGYPVVGDKIYGVDDILFLRFIENQLTETDRGALRLERQAVHSGSLELDHPEHGQRLRFKAEIPKDMAELFQSVRQGGSTVRSRTGER